MQPETNPKPTRKRLVIASVFLVNKYAEPNGVSLHVRAKPPPPFRPPGVVSRRRGDLRTLQAARVPSAPSRAPRDGRTAPPRFAASRTGCQFGTASSPPPEPALAASPDGEAELDHRVVLMLRLLQDVKRDEPELLARGVDVVDEVLRLLLGALNQQLRWIASSWSYHRGQSRSK